MLFPSIGMGELLLILFVLLLLFGAKRLPELASSLGKSMREFKKATSQVEKDLNADDAPKSSGKSSQNDE